MTLTRMIHVENCLPTIRARRLPMSRKPTLKLHMLGYWGMSRYEPLLPHPQDFVDYDWPEEERERIAKYLLGGYMVCIYGGCAVDRFCYGRDGDINQEMGDSELTDGIYCWPIGLAVYVRKYSVRLPEFFHQHIRMQNYIPPDHSQFEGKYEFDTSLRKWINWTRRNRKNRLIAMGLISLVRAFPGQIAFLIVSGVGLVFNSRRPAGMSGGT